VEHKYTKDYNMEMNKKREAIITSLSLTLDQHGNPVMDRHKIKIGSLKMYLEEKFPEYDHEQELINTCRWIDELLNDVQKTIEKEFDLDESIYLQERDVRSEGEVGDDQDVSEGEGSRRLY
jgi:hypothetical protein